MQVQRGAKDQTWRLFPRWCCKPSRMPCTILPSLDSKRCCGKDAHSGTSMKPTRLRCPQTLSGAVLVVPTEGACRHKAAPLPGTYSVFGRRVTLCFSGLFFLSLFLLDLFIKTQQAQSAYSLGNSVWGDKVGSTENAAADEG